MCCDAVTSSRAASNKTWPSPCTIHLRPSIPSRSATLRVFARPSCPPNAPDPPNRPRTPGNTTFLWLRAVTRRIPDASRQRTKGLCYHAPCALESWDSGDRYPRGTSPATVMNLLCTEHDPEGQETSSMESWRAGSTSIHLHNTEPSTASRRRIPAQHGEVSIEGEKTMPTCPISMVFTQRLTPDLLASLVDDLERPWKEKKPA